MHSFRDSYRALTGVNPFDWQSRLYRDFFSKSAIPSAVDIPTGLGKTSVMALWLMARARTVHVPGRLGLDRRPVVWRG